MSRSYYHRRHCKLWHCPHWFSRICIKTERQATRALTTKIVAGRVEPIDAVYPHGRRFEKRWSW